MVARSHLGTIIPSIVPLATDLGNHIKASGNLEKMNHTTAHRTALQAYFDQHRAAQPTNLDALRAVLTRIRGRYHKLIGFSKNANVTISIGLRLYRLKSRYTARIRESFQSFEMGSKTGNRIRAQINSTEKGT